jgi:hypothetical protein
MYAQLSRLLAPSYSLISRAVPMPHDTTTRIDRGYHVCLYYVGGIAKSLLRTIIRNQRPSFYS